MFFCLGKKKSQMLWVFAYDFLPTSYSENAQVEKPATGKFYVCT